MIADLKAASRLIGYVLAREPKTTRADDLLIRLYQPDEGPPPQLKAAAVELTTIVYTLCCKHDTFDKTNPEHVELLSNTFYSSVRFLRGLKAAAIYETTLTDFAVERQELEGMVESDQTRIMKTALQSNIDTNKKKLEQAREAYGRELTKLYESVRKAAGKFFEATDRKQVSSSKVKDLEKRAGGYKEEIDELKGEVLNTLELAGHYANRFGMYQEAHVWTKQWAESIGKDVDDPLQLQETFVHIETHHPESTQYVEQARELFRCQEALEDQLTDYLKRVKIYVSPKTELEDVKREIVSRRRKSESRVAELDDLIQETEEDLTQARAKVGDAVVREEKVITGIKNRLKIWAEENVTSKILLKNYDSTIHPNVAKNVGYDGMKLEDIAAYEEEHKLAPMRKTEIDIIDEAVLEQLVDGILRQETVSEREDREDEEPRTALETALSDAKKDFRAMIEERVGDSDKASLKEYMTDFEEFMKGSLSKLGKASLSESSEDLLIEMQTNIAGYQKQLLENLGSGEGGSSAAKVDLALERLEAKERELELEKQALAAHRREIDAKLETFHAKSAVQRQPSGGDDVATKKLVHVIGKLGDKLENFKPGMMPYAMGAPGQPGEPGEPAPPPVPRIGDEDDEVDAVLTCLTRLVKAELLPKDEKASLSKNLYDEGRRVQAIYKIVDLDKEMWPPSM